MITPLHDRVLIERLEDIDEKIGMIFIPDNAREKPQLGIVKAVGEGKYINGELIPLRVKLGDKVLFGKYSGQEIKIISDNILIMREDEILGIVVE